VRGIYPGLFIMGLVFSTRASKTGNLPLYNLSFQVDNKSADRHRQNRNPNNG